MRRVVGGARFYSRMREMPTRRRLHTTAVLLDREIDRRRKRAAGRIVIHPYRGYGRDEQLIVRGRVLLEKDITRANAAEPVWRNVVNTWRRFLSDEIAGARVVAAAAGSTAEGVTDHEGYFRIVLSVPGLPKDVAWHEVSLTLPEHGAAATAHALTPTLGTQFGIISDIDDTVVVTNATSLLGMARSVIRNAASRLPFEGVAELYSALHRGHNPLFYVSSSPWNLYELLHDFMDINRIPHGPMFLQDWGIDETTLILASHQTHKMAQIQELVDYYPALRFVLIGDSGQHDPEIYLQVIRSHRDRIAAAFIRDVTPDLRDQGVARIIEASNAAGVEMLYVRDSAEALMHARKMGLVGTEPIGL
jgi:phosphatidate phosphatase APP1